jgi:hypothetical protein
VKITVTTEIEASQPDLFYRPQNDERRLEWDAYLSEAYWLGGASVAEVGVDSFCKSRSGAVRAPRYVSYKPPVVAAVTMIDGPVILKSFSGSWRFTDLGNGMTQVAFTYNFKIRPIWLRWLLEPVAAYCYRKDMKRRRDAFKAWAVAGL